MSNPDKANEIAENNKINMQADDIQAGQCPKCGGNNLEYGVSEPLDGSIYYPYTCQDCNFDGDEFYNLEFVGHRNSATNLFFKSV